MSAEITISVPPDVLEKAQARAQRNRKDLAGLVAGWLGIYADGYDLILTASREQWEADQRRKEEGALRARFPGGEPS